MLLEEALTATPTTRAPLPPNEASQALLSFLRDELPNGGPAAEQRFVHLFPLVTDRCFGRLTVAPPPPDAPPPSAAPSRPTYRHAPDGWLSLSQNPVPSNRPVDADPVARLLRAPLRLPPDERAPSTRGGFGGGTGSPSLLDAAGADSSRGIHVDYPLDCLERRVADCFEELTRRSGGGAGTPSAPRPSGRAPGKDARSETEAEWRRRGEGNLCRLFDLLPEQNELRAFFRRRPPPTPGAAAAAEAPFGAPPPRSSPFGRSFGGSPRSSPATARPRPQRPRLPSPTEQTREPKLQLAMTEYYFLLFVRFPLLSAPASAPQPSGGRSAARPFTNGSYGASLYSYLFSTYLRRYLPSGASDEGAALRPRSELFLRLLAEFWLRRNLVPTTEDGERRFVAARGGAPALRDALDLSRAESEFRTLPALIQDGIVSTVKHLVGDLGLREGVERVSVAIRERRVGEREGSAEDGEVGRLWCLPPAMTVIQPALLNYIRVGLACGSIHHKHSSFHKALEVWLLWLEPWNFVVKKRMRHGRNGGGGSSPRDLLRAAAANVAHPNVEYYPHHAKPNPASKSAYAPQWEAYVCANVHFYAVPLAIFLRRARELEFSSSSEFPKSLALVQRVLRCYPKAIVTVINGVLNSRADAVTNGIVSRHVEELGPYAPPEDWKLMSCQVDGMNLLEEMFAQYQKRVRNMNLLEEMFAQYQKRVRNMNFIDRWEANIEALFSGTIRREEGNLQSISGQLKSLVGLPLEYQVPVEMAPQRSRGIFSFFGNASSGAQVDFYGPDRDSDGLLTDLGRRQLSTGERKCSPFEVKYLGDPMLKPYQSYEVPALVDLTIFLSNYLNDKLGFVPYSSLIDDAREDEDMFSRNIREMQRYNKITFRLNLRFLADYRNVLWISITVWVIRKLI